MNAKPATLVDINHVGDLFDAFLTDTNKRFLIVDNSPASQNMMTKALNQLGFNSIMAAKDGLDAILKLESTTGEIIILLELNLTGMNGIKFIQKMKATKRFEELKIIIVSNEHRKETVLSTMKLGALGYIVKPFTKALLIENLNRIGVNCTIK